MDSNTLKGCPLCGKEPVAIETFPGRGELYCGECDLTLGAGNALTPDELAERWNTRHAETCDPLPTDVDMTCIVRDNNTGAVMELGYWRCSECGCNNPDGAKHCMGCGREVRHGC